MKFNLQPFSNNKAPDTSKLHSHLPRAYKENNCQGEREREREMNPFPYRSMLWAGSYEYVPNPVIDRCGSEQPTALIMSHWAQRAPLFTTREYWETLYYKRLFLFPLLDLPAITSWNPNLLFVFEEVWGEQKPQHSCHCCNWLPLSPPSKLSHRPCSWALEIDYERVGFLSF